MDPLALSVSADILTDFLQGSPPVPSGHSWALSLNSAVLGKHNIFTIIMPYLLFIYFSFLFFLIMYVFIANATVSVRRSEGSFQGSETFLALNSGCQSWQ